MFITIILVNLLVISRINGSPIYYEERCEVNTHNAYNYLDLDVDNLIVPNQPNPIRSQLNNGITSFMFDLHEKFSSIVMCHGFLCNFDILSIQFFDVVMNQDVIPYLRTHSNAIISIIIEDEIDNDSTWESSLEAINDIEDYMFNPYYYRWDKTSTHWPRISDMIRYNQRLLIYTSSRSHSGYYSIHGESNNIYIMYQWDFTVENYWSMGSTIFSHDFSCTTRSDSDSLDSTSVRAYNFAWKPIFVMNHFHGVPERAHAGIDNQWSVLWLTRYYFQCRPASNKLPNYISIDWYDMGDAFEIADFTNNGGIILFEGNDLSGDIVCGIDTSFSRNINMQSNSIGCENDEARSMFFSDVAAGTLITLYDSPSRSKEDDFVIIYIKKYIGSIYDGQAIYVGSFENDIINYEYISMDFYRNNGLDGKLSYITIELNANPYSNSQIILYEGTSASQNIVCTVPSNTDRFINFKSDGYGCDNDEAKSFIITSAKKGTIIKLYDDPNGGTGDDWYQITVLNDFFTKRTVNSFESSFDDDFMSGSIHWKNGLNGKVSSIRIDIPSSGSDILLIPEFDVNLNKYNDLNYNNNPIDHNDNDNKYNDNNNNKFNKYFHIIIYLFCISFIFNLILISKYIRNKINNNKIKTVNYDSVEQSDNDSY